MWISILLTTIATILIAPSGSHWVFNLSGGSRIVSIVMLVIFWIINIIWFFSYIAKNNKNQESDITTEEEPTELPTKMTTVEFAQVHDEYKHTLKDASRESLEDLAKVYDVLDKNDSKEVLISKVAYQLALRTDSRW